MFTSIHISFLFFLVRNPQMLAPTYISPHPHNTTRFMSCFLHYYSSSFSAGINYGVVTVTVMTMTMAMSAFLSAVMFLLLRSAMPSCVPTEYTLYVEKPGCDYCVAINTTICTGFCFSRVR